MGGVFFAPGGSYSPSLLPSPFCPATSSYALFFSIGYPSRNTKAQKRGCGVFPPPRASISSGHDMIMDNSVPLAALGERGVAQGERHKGLCVISFFLCG